MFNHPSSSVHIFKQKYIKDQYVNFVQIFSEALSGVCERVRGGGGRVQTETLIAMAKYRSHRLIMGIT